MRKKVAVESGLSNVSEYLTQQGFDVLEFQHNNEIKGEMSDVDAVVITGMDENLLGIQDIETSAPVIEASGLTPAEIGAMINQKAEIDDLPKAY
ncbi:MAG TPA: YkuS family protein [Bacillota bacterium]|nr:YkuS family protein [Bacillota bacterium]